jgi:hypothetical protein
VHAWEIDLQIGVPVKNRVALGQETFFVGETQRTARAAEIRALVGVRDLQAPTFAVADVVADLIATVADAVDDFADALFCEPRQLKVGERAASNRDERLR